MLAILSKYQLQDTACQHRPKSSTDIARVCLLQSLWSFGHILIAFVFTVVILHFYVFIIFVYVCIKYKDVIASAFCKKHDWKSALFSVLFIFETLCRTERIVSISGVYDTNLHHVHRLGWYKSLKQCRWQICNERLDKDLKMDSGVFCII